jgi:hypothetical protein
MAFSSGWWLIRHSHYPEKRPSLRPRHAKRSEKQQFCDHIPVATHHSNVRALNTSVDVPNETPAQALHKSS